MDPGYWSRQPLQPSANVPKRQRTETAGAFPSQEAQIFPSQNEHGNIQTTKDSRVLGASYDRYLQNTQQLPSYGSTQSGLLGMSRSSGGMPGGGMPGGGMPGGGMPGGGMSGGGIHGIYGGKTSITYQDPVMFTGPDFRSSGPPEIVKNTSAAVGLRSQASADPMTIPLIPEREIPLPPDASCTLFVEGLPRDVSEREVAHIFRPFLGYKDIRVVKKESKYGGNTSIFCFVDFATPSYAMAAMGAVEGYMLDLHEPESSALHLQFAKFGSRRSNQNFHGRR